MEALIFLLHHYRFRGWWSLLVAITIACIFWNLILLLIPICKEVLSKIWKSFMSVWDAKVQPIMDKIINKVSSSNIWAFGAVMLPILIIISFAIFSHLCWYSPKSIYEVEEFYVDQADEVTVYHGKRNCSKILSDIYCITGRRDPKGGARVMFQHEGNEIVLEPCSECIDSKSMDMQSMQHVIQTTE